MKWGLELGTLSGDCEVPQLAPEISVDAQRALDLMQPADVESEAKARLFNTRRIGRNANDFLDEVDRQLLAEALLGLQTKPNESVEKAGQALEDFLRQVAIDQGLGAEAKKCNGAGQLGSRLLGKRVIHNHQQKLIDAASMFRNAKTHKKDKKTLKPWRITGDGAFSAVIATLTCIRSIYQYVYHRRQLL